MFYNNISIEVDNNTEITGDVVLLMDDVTTSNNSLKACKKNIIRSWCRESSDVCTGADNRIIGELPMKLIEVLSQIPKLDKEMLLSAPKIEATQKDVSDYLKQWGVASERVSIEKAMDQYERLWNYYAKTYHKHIACYKDKNNIFTGNAFLLENGVQALEKNEDLDLFEEQIKGTGFHQVSLFDEE